VVTGLQLGLAIYLFGHILRTPPGITEQDAMAFTERTDWISLRMGNVGRLSVDYYVGVDGLSIPMVLLAALVLFAGAVSSWTIDARSKATRRCICCCVPA
jgi:NADH-quinone oxidoreductase subunit M